MARVKRCDLFLLRDTQAEFCPFHVVSIIERNGPATRAEIADEIFRLTGGAFTCPLASHDRQISRLEKTFRVIEPLQKEWERALVRYCLTAKGKRLYAETAKKVITPLAEVLVLK